MLTGDSPPLYHLLQNLSLIFLSLLLLPLSTLILLATLPFRYLLPQLSLLPRLRARRRPSFRARTVLVTGVGMSKGLSLARTFHLAGHTVIGADFEPHRIPVSGRFSRSLKKFYTLPKPDGEESAEGVAKYVHALLQIVRKEKVDLWVSCSGVASAVEDGMAKEVLERKTDCRAIQFGVEDTKVLHEKSSFIARTRELGLPAPETIDVRSRDAVHKVLFKGLTWEEEAANERGQGNGVGGGEVLHKSSGTDTGAMTPPLTPRSKKRKSYIMKSVGVDDANRGNMTLLPRRTLSETYSHVSKIPISKDNPWILQEFIEGKEYCTHALVVRGKVKAFVACPSLELLMHYEALPADEGLSKAMESFTKEFARRSGPDFTGHLSFDFLVEESVSEGRVEKTLFPIECNPRCHTAIVLFQGVEEQMASAYMTALKSEVKMNGNGNGKAIQTGFHGDVRSIASRELTTLSSDEDIVRPSSHPAKYYWIGHDIVELILLPLLNVLRRKSSIAEFIDSSLRFVDHVFLWKDGTFEIWDPLPGWLLYQVYWPGQFLVAVMYNKKWSRINVSTAKMFRC
ncbi:hypothetical protein MMC25_000514 [Agyrium rufum]|nr:hypothetical protein [Agyrium rufum]